MSIDLTPQLYNQPLLSMLDQMSGVFSLTIHLSLTVQLVLTLHLFPTVLVFLIVHLFLTIRAFLTAWSTYSGTTCINGKCTSEHLIWGNIPPVFLSGNLGEQATFFRDHHQDVTQYIFFLSHSSPFRHDPPFAASHAQCYRRSKSPTRDCHPRVGNHQKMPDGQVIWFLTIESHTYRP